MALFCFSEDFHPPWGIQTFLGLLGDLNVTFLMRQHLGLSGEPRPLRPTFISRKPCLRDRPRLFGEPILSASLG